MLTCVLQHPPLTGCGGAPKVPTTVGADGESAPGYPPTDLLQVV